MKRIGLIAFLLSTVLFAQEKQVKLNETVITSQNFKTNVRNTPANISIVTSEDIEKIGAKDLVQALQNVPGISVKRYSGTIKFDIRGLNSMYSDKNALVTLDGVPVLTEQVASLPVENIERIEVIPGGGAILYGDKAIGGIINILTKSTANKKVYGNVYGEIGNYKYHKEGVTVGSKLTDNFIAEVGFTNESPTSWRHREDRKSQEARLKAKYLLNGGDIEFKYNYFENEKKNGVAIPKYVTDQDRRDPGGLWGGKYKSNDFYLKYRQEFSKDLEGLVYGNYFTRKNYSYNRKTDSFNKIKNDEDIRKYVKAELKKVYMNDNYFIIGTDWSEEEVKPNVGNKISRKTNFGIFAMNKINYDKFQFTQGIRYDKAKYDFYWRDGVLNLPEKRGTKDNHKYGNYSLELSGQYLYSDTGSAYLSYNRAFRTPVVREMVYTRNSEKLKSQIQDTIELGVKDFVANTYVSLSTYYKNTDNELYSAIPPEFTGMVNFNIGDTRRFGIEAFAEHYIGENLTINGGLTYINHKVKNGKYKNSHIPSVPNWKLTAGINYNITPKFNVGADWLYYSDSYDLDDISNDRGETVKGYSLFNLSAHYAFENGLSLVARVENIFDEKYNEYAGFWEDFYGKYPGKEVRQYYPAIGRNYSIGFNYKF